MICPDCIEELVPNKKQLGNKVNWMVCPKCGYRVRANAEEYAEFLEKERIINQRHTNNLTGGKHEIQF